jgi:hypothetical protein
LGKRDDVDAKVQKNANLENEGILGQLGFQVRIVQDENCKEVDLNAFAFHNWDEPSIHKNSERWGMLKIPMIVQSSYTAIAEKFLKRKILFFLNISYLQKNENGSWGKLIISQGADGITAATWKEEVQFEKDRQKSLRVKAQLKIRGFDPEKEEHQPDYRGPLKIRGIEPKKEEHEPDTRRQLPNIPQHNSLIDFDRQAEMKPINEFEEEMKPITRVVSVWEQKDLEKASRERYTRPTVQLDLAPEAAKALRDAKERIMNQHRNTFQSALEDTDGTIQDHLESSREFHLGIHQSQERFFFFNHNSNRGFILEDNPGVWRP